MARGDFTLFGEFGRDGFKGLHDLSTDVISMGIITTAVTPVSSQTDPKWGTYSANEVSTDDSQYPGPITLTGVTLTTVSSLVTMFDSSAIELTQNSSAFTDAGWGIIYNNSHSSDLAIGFVDLGGPVDLTGGPITITPNSSGWARITVS